MRNKNKYEFKKNNGNRRKFKILGDGIRPIKSCTEYTYLGVKIIRNGNHEDDIGGINKGGQRC